MGKARDLFKKIQDTKGIFHAKMGTIKDRDDKDLTEAEKIKKCQEYTEELFKSLNEPNWLGITLKGKKGGQNTQMNCTKKILMTWITMMVSSLT